MRLQSFAETFVCERVAQLTSIACDDRGAGPQLVAQQIPIGAQLCVCNGETAGLLVWWCKCCRCVVRTLREVARVHDIVLFV